MYERKANWVDVPLSLAAEPALEEAKGRFELMTARDATERFRTFFAPCPPLCIILIVNPSSPPSPYPGPRVHLASDYSGLEYPSPGPFTRFS